MIQPSFVFSYLGLFQNDARERISHVQDTHEYDTQLSVVSIVGKRGAGKSTVASLLSGNCSMFTVSTDKLLLLLRSVSPFLTDLLSKLLKVKTKVNEPAEYYNVPVSVECRHHLENKELALDKELRIRSMLPSIRYIYFIWDQFKKYL